MGGYNKAQILFKKPYTATVSYNTCNIQGRLKVSLSEYFFLWGGGGGGGGTGPICPPLYPHHFLHLCKEKLKNLSLKKDLEIVIPTNCDEAM